MLQHFQNLVHHCDRYPRGILFCSADYFRVANNVYVRLCSAEALRNESSTRPNSQEPLQIADCTFLVGELKILGSEAPSHINYADPYDVSREDKCICR